MAVRTFCGGPPRPTSVISVVGDIREEGLQLPSQRATAYAFVEDVRKEIWSINPNQTVSQIRTLEDIVEGQLFDRKLQAKLMNGFSVASMFLAALGVWIAVLCCRNPAGRNSEAVPIDSL